MDKSQIDKLETLVDELVKDSPKETRIRHCMEAAGLKYTLDPSQRLQTVLSALDGMRGASAHAVATANLKNTRTK